MWRLDGAFKLQNGAQQSQVWCAIVMVVLKDNETMPKVIGNKREKNISKWIKERLWVTSLRIIAILVQALIENLSGFFKIYMKLSMLLFSALKKPLQNIQLV